MDVGNRVKGMVFFVRDQGGSKSRYVSGIYYKLEMLRDPLAWTKVHGHFLIMGGFHVVEPTEDIMRIQSTKTTSTRRHTSPAQCCLGHGRGTQSGHGKKGRVPSKNKPESKGRVTILTLELLRKLIAQDLEFNIQISEEEITDRSKGDALSKLIFVLQSTWFIVTTTYPACMPIVCGCVGNPMSQQELSLTCGTVSGYQKGVLRYPIAFVVVCGAGTHSFKTLRIFAYLLSSCGRSGCTCNVNQDALANNSPA